MRVTLDESIPLGQIEIRYKGQVITVTDVDPKDAREVAESIMNRIREGMDVEDIRKEFQCGTDDTR